MSDVASRAAGHLRTSATTGGRTVGTLLKHYLLGVGAQLALGVWAFVPFFAGVMLSGPYGAGVGTVVGLAVALVSVVAVGAARVALGGDDER